MRLTLFKIVLVFQGLFSNVRNRRGEEQEELHNLAQEESASLCILVRSELSRSTGMLQYRSDLNNGHLKSGKIKILGHIIRFSGHN